MPGAPSQDGDRFVVLLQGRAVECLSLEDAAAIKMADGLLADGDSHIYSSDELDRIAGVLLRYGRQQAAETLAQRASRLRAAKFLNDGIL
jgi:hypothetical protein